MWTVTRGDKSHPALDAFSSLHPRSVDVALSDRRAVGPDGHTSRVPTAPAWGAGRVAHGTCCALASTSRFRWFIIVRVTIFHKLLQGADWGLTCVAGERPLTAAPWPRRARLGGTRGEGRDGQLAARPVPGRLARAHRGDALVDGRPQCSALCDLEGFAGGPPASESAPRGSCRTCSPSSCGDRGGDVCATRPLSPVGSTARERRRPPGRTRSGLLGSRAGDTQGQRLPSGLAHAHGVARGKAAGAVRAAVGPPESPRPPSASAPSSVPGQRRPASPEPAPAGRGPGCGAAAPSRPARCPSRSLKGPSCPRGGRWPAATSPAVPKETLGSDPAHRGTLQPPSWGDWGGREGPSAGRGRGKREANPTFSFISVKINQIVRNGT